MKNHEYNFIKEIYEQPDVIRKSLKYADPLIEKITNDYAGKVNRIIFVGCGDPFMLGFAAAYAFEMWAKVTAQAIEAAEFSMYRHLVDEKVLVVLISSSGKTVKVIDAARLAKERGAPTVALTNLDPSPITAESELVIQTQAGWSDSFPTKQTTTALAVLYALALRWASKQNTIPQEEITKLKQELFEKVPEFMKEAFKYDRSMQSIADQFLDAPIYNFIGSGPNLVTAMLGAAKMKETSQSRSEYSNLEEYAHLHCLSLKEDDLVFVISEPGSIGERNRLVCEHIKANGGKIVVIGQNSESESWEKLDVKFISLPDHNVMFGPLILWIPLQLFAYYTSIGKDRNPDRPPQRGPMDYLQKIIYTSMLEGWEDR